MFHVTAVFWTKLSNRHLPIDHFLLTCPLVLGPSNWHSSTFQHIIVQLLAQFQVCYTCTSSLGCNKNMIVWFYSCAAHLNTRTVRSGEPVCWGCPCLAYAKIIETLMIMKATGSNTFEKTSIASFQLALEAYIRRMWLLKEPVGLKLCSGNEVMNTPSQALTTRTSALTTEKSHDYKLCPIPNQNNQNLIIS